MPFLRDAPSPGKPQVADDKRAHVRLRARPWALSSISASKAGGVYNTIVAKATAPVVESVGTSQALSTATLAALGSIPSGTGGPQVYAMASGLQQGTMNGKPVLGKVQLGAVGLLDDSTTYTSDVNMYFTSPVTNSVLAFTNPVSTGNGFKSLTFDLSVNGVLDTTDSMTFSLSDTDPDPVATALDYFSNLNVNLSGNVNEIELNLQVTGDGFGINATQIGNSAESDPTAVPEPSTWMLLVVGATTLFAFRAATGRQKRRRIAKGSNVEVVVVC